MEDYRKRLNGELLKNGHDVNVRTPDGYQEAPLAYDAIWAVALGKRPSISMQYDEEMIQLSLYVFISIEQDDASISREQQVA